jgi:hypothetical protein
MTGEAAPGMAAFKASRRTRLLVNAFFGRLFENDVFSSSAAASSAAIWLLAALAIPGVMVSGRQMFFYAWLQHQPASVQDRSLLIHQTFHIDFVMAMAGVLTMIVWSSLTPDRRDAQVLGPLPLPVGEQARARLLALLKFFGMFVTALALPTAVVFTFVTVGPAQVTTVPQKVLAHIGGAVGGAGFAFFVLLDVQLVLAAVVGPRAVRLVAFPLQAAAIAGTIAAISLSSRMATAMLQDGATAAAWVAWNPAAWFVGLYRWLAGDHRAVFADLAARGALSVTAASVVGVAAYPFAYRHSMRHVIDSEGWQMGRVSRTGARLMAFLLRPLLQSPFERGLGAFILATLARSHPHRFLVGSYAGLGLLFALPFASRLLGPAANDAARYAWLSVPLGLTFWLVAGTRVALMLPVETAANWTFKLTEPVDKRRALTTVATMMAAVTAAPLAAAFGAGAALMGGERLGLFVAVTVFLVGLCLVEASTLTLRALPFTCLYTPGQLRMRVFWPIYFLIWYVVTWELPRVGLRALAAPHEGAPYDWRAGVPCELQLCGWLLATWIVLRVWRLARARRLRAFVYDDSTNVTWSPTEITPSSSTSP